jgi:hypothetical protein
MVVKQFAVAIAYFLAAQLSFFLRTKLDDIAAFDLGSPLLWELGRINPRLEIKPRWLESWLTELPEQEAHFVSEYLFALCLSQTDSTFGLAIRAKQDRLGARCGGLRSRCHLSSLPRRRHTGHWSLWSTERRVTVISAHFVKPLNPVLGVDCAQFGHIRRPADSGFEATCRTAELHQWHRRIGRTAGHRTFTQTPGTEAASGFSEVNLGLRP